VVVAGPPLILWRAVPAALALALACATAGTAAVRRPSASASGPGQDPQGRTVQVMVLLPIEFLEAPPPAR
jgi:hypothetical protein